MGATVRLFPRLVQTATLGAVWPLEVSNAVSETRRVRPYEIVGPAGLGSNERLCRRLAAAFNAEGLPELTALREEALFLHVKENGTQ
jgi:hypothetical protein